MFPCHRSGRTYVLDCGGTRMIFCSLFCSCYFVTYVIFCVNNVIQSFHRCEIVDTISVPTDIKPQFLQNATVLNHLWQYCTQLLQTMKPTIKKTLRWTQLVKSKQVVKVIWQKAPHGGPIPRLGVTPGGRKLYHWIPGVGFPISFP